MLRHSLIRQWAIRIFRRTWLLDRFSPRTTRSLKHSPRRSSHELKGWKMSCSPETATQARSRQSMTRKEPQDQAVPCSRHCILLPCSVARIHTYTHICIQTHKRVRSTTSHKANAGACSRAVPKHGYLRPPNTSSMLRQLLIRQWAIRILRRTWLLDRFLPRTTRSLKHSPRKSPRELCE